jgi:phosphonoacetaldehyde hydrolase
MLDFLAERAREQGLQPDLSLCPDDVPAGRPAPWMCYLSAVRLGVFPLWQMVKIGDTPSDVEEGRNAGMWTIGITRTGNEVGLTAAEWESTAPAERHSLLTAADTRLAAAHYRAEAVADCLPLLEDIGLRIARGERP